LRCGSDVRFTPESGHWLAAVLALRGHFGDGDVTDVAQLALGGLVHQPAA
jgi:hypothetical protein